MGVEFGLAFRIAEVVDLTCERAIRRLGIPLRIHLHSTDGIDFNGHTYMMLRARLGDSGYDIRKPMPHLLKTEPEAYSYANLERDRETIWDGVTNPTAVKHLREMKPGEKLVIYHTGDERRAVGTATVVSVAAKDPKTPLVRIKVGSAIKSPRTLAEIKEHKLFADSPLVKQGRLSVVPLTEQQYEWLIKG
jgi:predicted RNA-binding protein with PUA-like domain